MLILMLILLFFLASKNNKPLGDRLREEYPKFWKRTFVKNCMYSFPEHSPSDVMNDKEFKKWVDRFGYMLDINN